MDHGERQISITRVEGKADPRYRLEIEGFEAILVKADSVSHVLGLVFGKDAAGPFKRVIDGPARQLVAYRSLDPVQLAGLSVLLKVDSQGNR